MRYGGRSAGILALAFMRECARHHIGSLDADKVRYLNGASSLDTVSS
jgi:hypothetical protein